MSTQTPQQYPSNPYSPQASLGPPNKPTGTATASGSGGWKWLVIILGIIGVSGLACCGACAGVGYFGKDAIMTAMQNALKQAPPYQTAIAKIRADETVKEKVGESLQDEFLLNEGFQFNDHGSSGNANFELNLKGDKGTAKAHITAKKDGQDWKLEICKVTFADGTSVDLAGGEEAAPAGEEASGEMKEEAPAPTPP